MPDYKPRGWTYDVHPGVAMVQDWIATLKQKSGRSLDEWLALANTRPRDERARTEWLKREHGLGTNNAAWIAARSLGKGEEDEDPDKYLATASGWVESMFAGPKAALRPLYDLLLDAGRALGADVRVCPCSTIVPLYRKHVFAQLKPSTRTRIDLGLALRDTPVSGKLIDTGGFEKKDRITRRIAIEKPADFNAEAKRWLRKAYEMDA